MLTSQTSIETLRSGVSPPIMSSTLSLPTEASTRRAAARPRGAPRTSMGLHVRVARSRRHMSPRNLGLPSATVHPPKTTIERPESTRAAICMARAQGAGPCVSTRSHFVAPRLKRHTSIGPARARSSMMDGMPRPSTTIELSAAVKTEECPAMTPGCESDASRRSGASTSHFSRVSENFQTWFEAVLSPAPLLERPPMTVIIARPSSRWTRVEVCQSRPAGIDGNRSHVPSTEPRDLASVCGNISKRQWSSKRLNPVSVPPRTVIVSAFSLPFVVWPKRAEGPALPLVRVHDPDAFVESE
eukprot:Amastigsp_a843772_18.p3 type:complete len:300 gc:universal Amastigsp_a843772_18:31-930(+)